MYMVPRGTYDLELLESIVLNKIKKGEKKTWKKENAFINVKQDVFPKQISFIYKPEEKKISVRLCDEVPWDPACGVAVLLLKRNFGWKIEGTI